MVFFKAGKLQRLADLLQRVQDAIERAGGESVAGVEADLADAARRAGLDLEVIRLADLSTLEGVLAPGGQPGGSGKCWAAAEVLFLDGLRARAEGRDEEARSSFEKARALFSLVGEGLTFPEGVPAPAERVRRIEELTGPTD